MIEIVHTPYTYLIGWSHHNKWYYGVRFSKKANPDELWVSYFTSSKHVKLFREKFGEPDVIEVRKTFSTVNEARNWENKVLKKMNCTSDEKWLNKTDNFSISIEASKHGWSLESRERQRKSQTGRKHSIESRLKRSLKFKGRANEWMVGKKRPEHAQKMTGGDNPKARKVFYDGKLYNTLKEFAQAFGLSNYHAKKLLKGE